MPIRTTSSAPAGPPGASATMTTTSPVNHRAFIERSFSYWTTRPASAISLRARLVQRADDEAPLAGDLPVLVGEGVDEIGEQAGLVEERQRADGEPPNRRVRVAERGFEVVDGRALTEISERRHRLAADDRLRVAQSAAQRSDGARITKLAQRQDHRRANVRVVALERGDERRRRLPRTELAERRAGRRSYRRRIVLQRGHERLDRAGIAQLLEDADGQAPHGGIGISERADQRVHRGGVGQLLEGHHGELALAGVGVRQLLDGDRQLHVAHRSRNGMPTVTASAGQSTSHGVQYQHSSRAMYALPVSGWMASASSGHTSTQRWQPLMHFDSSTVTGTSNFIATVGIAVSSRPARPGSAACGTPRARRRSWGRRRERPAA